MIISPDVLFPALAAIATGGGASLLTYLSVRLGKSGRINSSEADDLWKESGAIRRELREQVRALEARCAENEEEIIRLRAENAELKHELLTVRAENAALSVEVGRLTQENKELKQATLAVEGRQREMQGEAT